PDLTKVQIAVSSSSPGACQSYSWDFGNGAGTSALQNPVYSYSSPGRYNVTLNVTDTSLLVCGQTQNINVSARTPGVPRLWHEYSPFKFIYKYQAVECNDGIDNDGDGSVDFPNDSDCASSTDSTEFLVCSSQCCDKIDNDADGLIDYPYDPECSVPEDLDESIY
ncbi:MAG: PKD domain-containing protein, partial [Patescibacteria group bacterium]